MIDCNEFDMWAGNYDEEVQIADDNNDYPFAGYKAIMNSIYAAVMKKNSASILDIGVGTGTLAAALYACGHRVTGIDFASEMLAIAKPKMPDATFYQYDFANGLPPGIAETKYDFIISTYALHHLNDGQKVTFIKALLPHLTENGAILIGDIGFPTKVEFSECKAQNADDWDDNEYYFVFSELIDALKGTCAMTYEQMSHCSGIMEIRPS